MKRKTKIVLLIIIIVFAVLLWFGIAYDMALKNMPKNNNPNCNTNQVYNITLNQTNQNAKGNLPT
jgi:hypothetical protein